VLISQSFWRKSFVTLIAVAAFASVYEVTILDSRYAARQATLRESMAMPAPGVRLAFTATAYCKGTVTASGAAVHRGMAAADRDLLPVGSIIQVDAADSRYDGIYSVLDTGPAVQGRHIDLYMWSCYEALDFGRQPVHVTVLRMGWNPNGGTAR
jgi:3D (Asp-Asp-Asp) domain-containing protein